MSDDMINHPPHYTQGWSNGAQVADITDHLDFMLGNVVKYACRAGRKKGASTTDDLLKARWYLERKIRATVNTSSMPLVADIDLVVDAHLVLRDIGVDLADVSAHKDLLFVEGDLLHYSIPHADDDGDIRWYEPRTTPWPSPARLNLMRARYGLSLLDDARVEAVDAIRRLAAQVEAENNKKESTDE
mgnify:FL=1